MVFGALGVWQVERLQWKHALIARVDARIHAAPTALPAEPALSGPALSHQGVQDREYLRVFVTGTYIADATSLVRAMTEYGTGYWAMTPLRLGDGRIVWINRGYVPVGTMRGAAGASAPAGAVTAIGLLRDTEPGGSVLQSNRPAEERWYSRDVAALSKARGIGKVVPAFIDMQVERAERPAAAALKPIAGLTQVHFPDNHLMYALTWFAMAVLSAVALVYIWRRA